MSLKSIEKISIWCVSSAIWCSNNRLKGEVLILVFLPVSSCLSDAVILGGSTSPAAFFLRRCFWIVLCNCPFGSDSSTSLLATWYRIRDKELWQNSHQTFARTILFPIMWKWIFFVEVIYCGSSLIMTHWSCSDFSSWETKLDLPLLKVL